MLYSRQSFEWYRRSLPIIKFLVTVLNGNIYLALTFWQNSLLRELLKHRELTPVLFFLLRDANTPCKCGIWSFLFCPPVLPSVQIHPKWDLNRIIKMTRLCWPTGRSADTYAGRVDAGKSVWIEWSNRHKTYALRLSLYAANVTTTFGVLTQEHAYR